MFKYPKISVCIPTYNYGKFISDSIESVISQTCKDFEIIIVDNCSVDETEEIVKAYVDVYDNVKYFRNAENIGMTENWNRCLNLSTGKYVKILCADDILVPTCLQKSLEIFENHEDIVLLATARLFVDEKLKLVTSMNYDSRDKLEVGYDVIKNCLINGNLIGEPSAVLFKRECSFRGFNKVYTQLTDLEMWFHILGKGNFAYINDALCKIRQHDGQETKSNIKSLVFADEEFQLLEEYANKNNVNLTPRQKNKAKFKKSLILWRLKNSENLTHIKQKISQYYNLKHFYFKLILRKIIKIRLIRRIFF